MKPPIADPFAAPSDAAPSRVFRIDLVRGFLGCLWLFCLIFTPILRPEFVLGRRNYDLLDFLGTLIIASLGYTFLALFFSTRVSASGIKGNNFWGVKSHVAWSEIATVRFRWFGFGYAVVSTSHRRSPLWLPLCLKDKIGFARAIEEWAPEDNPLRLFLQKRGF